jgi:hypothetical protein
MCLLTTGAAAAGELPEFGMSDVFNALQGDQTVPPEWAGIWSVTDSIFLCSGFFLFADSQPELDTLCTGMTFDFSDPEDPFQVTCSGTVTGSVVDVTCTGSGEDPPGCQLTVTIEYDATRTGENYVAETIVDIVATGSVSGCESACIRTKTVGTRVAPEPSSYCATVVGVPPTAALLEALVLSPSVPNPVLERTTIGFDLPLASEVILRIVDVTGHVVRVALDNEAMRAGRHRWDWDLRDDAGARVAPGVYFATLEAAGTSRASKIVIMR